ncbi:hypothetical protein IFM89_017826 [Coptis chinensis]|uniref:YDG domain-containing protein n=1 Tax=Coptis chinensis TaxID=261450 RepID=A0A835H429_9MAGN|nr:hypothetical protein IFM89_017826 [Coptis chinensis]
MDEQVNDVEDNRGTSDVRSHDGEEERSVENSSDKDLNSQDEDGPGQWQQLNHLLKTAVGTKKAEDQKLEQGNLYLKNSIDEKTPVRVIRGFKETKGIKVLRDFKEKKGSDMLHTRGKRISTYTYDGLYMVERNGGEIPFNHDGAIVEAKPLIYECGPSCKCPPSCYNRVSQHGIKFQLEIFKIKSRGWGVRSLRPSISN